MPDVTDPAHVVLLGRASVENDAVASVAFSPDGHILASADGSVSGNSTPSTSAGPAVECHQPG